MARASALQRFAQYIVPFADLEQVLNHIVIGQERYTRALLTALLAREHVALISPPGTAKTYLVRSLTRLIKGLNYYKTLFTPFTTYDEVFGPIDVAALLEGKVKRKWSNIVRSDVAFLDEGFKANPALLNSLLSFLNERIVYDPFSGQEIKTPLKTAIIASNEIPEDETLRALWDRISIRVYGNYVTEDESIREIVESYWRQAESLLSKPILTKKELEEAEKLVMDALQDPATSSEVASLLTEGLMSDTIDLYMATIVPILKALGRITPDYEESAVSTRTLTQKLPKIFIAEALLNLARAEPPPLAVLDAAVNTVMYLASDQDDASTLEASLDRLLNPIRGYVEALRVAYRYILDGMYEEAAEALDVFENMPTELGQEVSFGDTRRLVDLLVSSGVNLSGDKEVELAPLYVLVLISGARFASKLRKALEKARAGAGEAERENAQGKRTVTA